MEIIEILNDYNMAVLGLTTALAILLAYLFEKYMPLEPEKPPKIIEEDDPNLKKSREELLKLETPIKGMKFYTLAQLAENDGAPDKMAWVCNKGMIFDVSANEVYKQNGGYNCFSGKDATLSLGKMLFELSGEREWRQKLNHEELCVVEEWNSWFLKRYPVVGYLKEEYDEEERLMKEAKDGKKNA